MEAATERCEIPLKDNAGWVLSPVDRCFKPRCRTALIKMAQSLKAEDITTSCQPRAEPR